MPSSPATNVNAPCSKTGSCELAAIPYSYTISHSVRCCSATAMGAHRRIVDGRPLTHHRFIISNPGWGGTNEVRACRSVERWRMRNVS